MVCVITQAVDYLHEGVTAQYVAPPPAASAMAVVPAARVPADCRGLPCAAGGGKEDGDEVRPRGPYVESCLLHKPCLHT